MVRFEVNAVIDMKQTRHDFRHIRPRHAVMPFLLANLSFRTTPTNIECYPKGCAATRGSAGLVQHMKAPEQAQKDTSPRKINVTSKSPVGDISVVTLIRTDTTLDQSPKAEKVCAEWNGGS